MKKQFSRFSDFGLGRIRALLWLVVAGAIFLATVFSANAGRIAQDASEEPQPAAISEASEQTPSGDAGEQSLDDQFAEAARRNPAFGGMFVDEQRQILFIYSKDARAEAATSLKEGVEAVLGPGRVPQFRTEVLPAQYSFAELAEWQERMTANILEIPGVVLVDVDDTKNRVTVGVEKLLIRCAVEDQLSRLGVPREAINIEVTPAVELEVSLRDRHRPLVGGLQISFQSGASTFLCTLGFNAIRGGVAGFVTNSHCTATQGGVQSTVMHQPTIAGTTNRVGVETVDPTYFTGGVCPAGRRCRRSDSAFVRRDAGVTANLGRIARPALGSFAWNGVNTFRITGEAAPIVGQTVTKVGRTTGRTQGAVTRTCINVNVLGTNITQLCQSQAGYGSAGGDSGSPVFRITNSPAANDVILGGIHWGGGGTFSPITGIQRSAAPAELGPLTNCAVGGC